MAVNDVFFGWIFGFGGKVKITAPEDVKEKYAEMVRKAGESEHQVAHELLESLGREIHLYDSYVAGTMYLEDQTVLDEIEVGDRLNLIREDNEYDENAIMIYTEAEKKLGYVPRKANIVFAWLMDAGKTLSAKIQKIEQSDSFTSISIGIYLVVF